MKLFGGTDETWPVNQQPDAASILLQKKIDNALELAMKYGTIDGGHHKMWVIDQIVRCLIDDDTLYKKWVDDGNYGEDGPNTYDWDEGIAP